MDRDFYTPPKPSRIMKLLWKAAGGDPFILERATYSDQVKYMCLGGIITATGLMAAFAGGYAFYTIFETKGSAIDQHLQTGTMAIAIVFGVAWGLMIFNLDRFIVSSTGKGDGTEAITWQELKGAIPRIVMGAIIAMTISKPVEIRMFKSEIDAELHARQLEKRKEYETRTRANYDGRFLLLNDELKKFETEREDTLQRVKKLEQEETDQLQGRAGAGAGDGPLAQALRNNKQTVVNELANLDAKNKPRLDELTQTRQKLIQEMDSELGKNEQVANGLDGLLERIKLSDDLAGFWISAFVTLLFMAIELTPIFFKLMLVKSPYDFLKDNIEELIKAENGIYVEPNYYKDKKGQERDLVTYLRGKRSITEQKSLFDVQKKLTDFALEKYEKQMLDKIEANPERYVTVEETGFQPNEA